MKKVILETKDTVSLSEVGNYSYIGIKNPRDDRFISVYSEIEDCYYLLNSSLEICGSHYQERQEQLKDWLSTKSAEIFIFETKEELIKWLLNNDTL